MFSPQKAEPNSRCRSPGLVRMLFPDLIVGDWHKGRVLDLVDAVVAQHGGPATLRYQQDVIALQETNEALKTFDRTVTIPLCHDYDHFYDTLVDY